MTNVLEKIIETKKTEVAELKANMPLYELHRQAAAAPAPAGFAAALKAASVSGYGLIAELKKASPSKGLIRADFDIPTLARAYADGGASCLSVLTDRHYFQGDDAFLMAARTVSSLPVLRKDFMIDPVQIVHSRALGADCILLIMAALSDAQAQELEAAAHELGMDRSMTILNLTEPSS